MEQILNQIARAAWLLPLSFGAYRFITKENNKELNAVIAGVGLAGFLLTGGSKDETKSYLDNEVKCNGGCDERLVKSLLSRLSTTLFTTYYSGNADERCQALKAYYNAYELEFRVVANEFLKKHNKTIRQAINETYTDGCSDSFWYGNGEPEWGDKVIQRFDALKIA